MESVLKISDAANLAIHAMGHIAVAGPERSHSVAEISSLQGVSEAHLSKVMQRLVKAGLLTSRRGPGGGFVLGRSADAITLLDIFEAIDGPIGTETCLFARETCLFKGCALGGLMRKLNRQVKEFFASRRLSEFRPE
jgi:Rrf2 family transcriptional regulator, nitric oxide-sensitive transcriptional repressor